MMRLETNSYSYGKHSQFFPSFYMNTPGNRLIFQPKSDSFLCELVLTESLRGADYLVRFMEKFGMRHIFGVPGGHALNLIDAFGLAEKLKFVLTVHEQGAAFMATGHYLASQKVSAVVGTAGPGAANIASGLDSAYANSVPVLALTAQVPIRAFGRGFVQTGEGWGPRGFSHAEAFKGVTKWSVMVPTVERLPYVLRRAFRTMLSGRMGPVHVDLPIDIQSAPIVDDIEPPEKYMPHMAGPDSEMVRQAAQLLVKAKSPAILAGLGVIRSGAYEELRQLSEMLIVPVATSLNGKGAYPEDFPLALGTVGVFGQKIAGDYLRRGRTDVLLAVGCSFSTVTTFDYSMDFGGDAIIQVDSDPGEIAKNCPIKLGLVSDARLFLRDLLAQTRSMLEKDAHLIREMERRRTETLPQILKMKKETNYFGDPVEFSDEVPTKPQRALREISSALPKDAIIFPDCGDNLVFTEKHLPVYTPGSFNVDGWLTHMGFSVAAIIGAKMARPDRVCVSICGDQSFLMLFKEIITAKRHNVPAIWCILDNACHGAVRAYQKLMFKGRYFATIPPLVSNPDFVKLAETLGAYGVMAEKPQEIGPILKSAINSGKPAVIDIKIDPEEIHPGAVVRMKALGTQAVT